MTAAGWGLLLGGACSLFAACWWVRRDQPERETRAMLWIVLSVATIAASLVLFTAQPIPKRAAFFALSANKSIAAAPIAGAPLVRIDEAFSTFQGRRLPLSVADVERVIP